ncbi:hypothetical protein ABT346_04900 [Micromonospora peucetia]|uniref:hypothetical protein n=1 Tax=Micromonospora peucetia TaxID=47871 RepID=UPI003316918E
MGERQRVLFLAVGGARKRAVLEESAEVVAGGGSATVLISEAAAWRRERFPAGVRVVSLSELDRHRLPVRIEQNVLYRAPRFAFRMVGRGRLSAFGKRAGRAYENRIADRVHRRIFLPAYGRLQREGQFPLLVRHVLRAATPQLVVITDPASIPLGATLVSESATYTDTPPQICFGLDYLTPTG